MASTYALPGFAHPQRQAFRRSAPTEMALVIAALIALTCAGAAAALLLLLLHGPTPADSHTTMLPSLTTATAPR
jgi:hypothetical protein